MSSIPMSLTIRELFQKDITRAINGVVKADQLDEASIFQELDEYVVTKELDRHFRQFFESYLKVIKNANDPETAGQVGVWVSGFFGSGKSHFIKILSYLLANRAVQHDGQTRRAVEFFEEKIKDSILYADIKRAVASGAGGTDVILFNIESKANPSDGRGAILKVFLKVFNEMLGYSGDHPHIAAMERHLDEQGKLEAFHAAFKAVHGGDWLEERDAYQFNIDETVRALSQVLGQSEEASRHFLETAEERFPLTPENFAGWVADYLKRKEPGHRVLFLADEVGAFIGSDTQLMLSLQTITENLGTACKGRAWVLVTSQENIEAVLGEVRASKANDFSKIQGRFRTRLSLSSSNTDEVIQERLLDKTPEARAALEGFYAQKGDLLKNHLSFVNVNMTFKKLDGAASFVSHYPFVPYQFQLLQKVFEEIRRHGATGLHLSRGERSMLDAFKSAAEAVGHQPIGALVPLYRFYPSIESFLDTSVKRTIDQASERGLSPFDVEVLRTLFLIRYVNEFKGNIDNLVTLCVDEIDADRLELKRRIEASLQRLEAETLIGRNGDDFFFLTNEERDISREIKEIELNSGDDSRALGELIFKEVLKDNNKHRYIENKKDFGFNRFCDGIPFGSLYAANELLVTVVSPLADDYAEMTESRCILDSSTEGGKLLIKLGNDDKLARELTLFLKTDRYVKRTSDPTLAETTKRILSERQQENQVRKARLIKLVEGLILSADYYVSGQLRQNTASAVNTALAEQLNYLIKNTFAKLSYLKVLKESPNAEMQAVLRANDMGQQSLEITSTNANAAAIDDVLKFIQLADKQKQQIVLGDLVDRYAKRPYGWPDFETVLIVARLQVIGEISIVADGATVPPEKTYDLLSKTAKWRSVTIVKRQTVASVDLQQARSTGQKMFAQMGPEAEDALVAFLRGKLTDWQGALKQFETLAHTGNYPGSEDIERSLLLVKNLLTQRESYGFIAAFNQQKDDLLDLADDFKELEFFYAKQRATWEGLRRALDEFNLNRSELEKNAGAKTALAELRAIIGMARPYGRIKDVEALTNAVRTVNDDLVQARRAGVAAHIGAAVRQLEGELQNAGITGGEQGGYLRDLRDLELRSGREKSLGNLSMALQQADEAKDQALGALEAEIARRRAAVPVGTSTAISTPKIKQRRVIEPKKLTGKTYLETMQDVDAFLDTLRSELEKAIELDERVEIR